jgi:hypothetical protein
MSTVLAILSFLGKYPQLLQSVMGILASDKNLIPAILTLVKSPSWAGVIALLEGNPETVQQVVSAVNTTVQADPQFLPAAIATATKTPLVSIPPAAPATSTGT